MASVLSLQQGACLILKQRPIATVGENTPFGVALNLVFAEVVEYMLESGDWKFAARTVALDPSTSEQPSFGFNYFFDKPTDYAKRVIAISSSPFFYPTLDNYDDTGTVWAADCNPLYVQYVSNDPTLGLNYGNWGNFFARATEYELAMRVGPGRVQLSNVEWKDIRTAAKQALHEAKSKDTVNLAAERPPPGQLVRSRMGYRAWGRGGRWGC